MSTKDSAKIDPARNAPVAGVVRISVPASVAADLGAFQKSLAGIAERLGCRTCFSGADCFFQIERDWLINEKLEVSPAVVRAGPHPEPWRAATATLAPGVSRDLKKIQDSVAKIAGLLGCQACCSGFDIFFRQELNFMVDEQLNVRGQ